MHRQFIVEGIIWPNGENQHHIGKKTYLAVPCAGTYQWDGRHRAAIFNDPVEAVQAARNCVGPWFFVPDPNSIRAISIDVAVDEAAA